MGRYGKSPAEVLANPRIGFVAKSVYSALAMCRNTRTGQCNPSHAALCGLLHVKERGLVYALRALEKEGRFKKLHEEYFALCGIGTNVAMSKELGARVAGELARREVSAAIYTST